MQAFNSIQNATINAIAGFQAGLVVDAANAHRTYLRPERTCEVRRVSKHPKVDPSSVSLSGDSSSLKQGLKPGMMGRGTGSGTMLGGKKWRMEHRHLPATAWAMLVLNRTMCG
jgi:hypothetical protein